MSDEQIPFIDDVTCHEKWSEATQVILGPAGAIKIEFCVYRWAPYPPIVRTRVSPVARVAMTVDAARFLRDSLTAQLDNLQKQVEMAQLTPASPTKN